MRTEIGKIRSIQFGFGGYQDAQFGITVDICGKGWGVGDFFVATQNGLEWFARKIANRRAARAAKLDAAANAALAAQVDALPDPK